MMPSDTDSGCFFDTFVFEGNRVRKMGRIVKVDITEEEDKPAEEKLAKVYWVESLRKTK